jgi:hypothetical protein
MRRHPCRPTRHRFRALEAIRQGVRQYFGGFAKSVACSLSVRHWIAMHVRHVPEGRLTLGRTLAHWAMITNATTCLSSLLGTIDRLTISVERPKLTPQDVQKLMDAERAAQDAR